MPAGATDSEAAGFSQYDSFRNSDGTWKWPVNDGFVAATIRQETLPAGTRLDRYGRETGYYLAPEGTPLPERALAPGGGAEPVRTYELVKPLPVKIGETAPAFGQPGGGTQILTPASIRQLLDEGYFKEMP